MELWQRLVCRLKGHEWWLVVPASCVIVDVDDDALTFFKSVPTMACLRCGTICRFFSSSQMNSIHFNEPHHCEILEGSSFVMPELVGQSVTYVSESGREWEALVTATHDNGYKNPKGNTLPLVCLEFRNERGKLIRKHRVLPYGWAYWCPPSNRGQVWKLKTSSV